MMYWYKLVLLMMSTCCSKHVEAWNKYIEKESVKSVINLKNYSVFLSPPMNIYLLSVSVLFCISFSLHLHCNDDPHNGHLFTVFIFKPWLKSSCWPTGCILCFCLQLDLGYNSLSALDRHLLGHWQVLQYLNLVGNPWMCDCENQWMVSTLLPTVESVIHYQLDSLT